MSAGFLRVIGGGLACLALVAFAGCQSPVVRGQSPELLGDCISGNCPADLPTEKDMTNFPTYTIEPPDVLRVAIAGEMEPCEHVVAPDGTIYLGRFGNVYVTGMTIDEARSAIAQQLSQFQASPQITLEVVAYQSKVYYVIVDRGCFGQELHRLAATGNETVLDAVAQVPSLCSMKHRRVWIARPGEPGSCRYQILPVRWEEITKVAGTTTNYQVLPGDRVYVADEGWCAPLKHLFGAMPSVNDHMR